MFVIKKKTFGLGLNEFISQLQQQNWQIMPEAGIVPKLP